MASIDPRFTPTAVRYDRTESSDAALRPASPAQSSSAPTSADTFERLGASSVTRQALGFGRGVYAGGKDLVVGAAEAGWGLVKLATPVGLIKGEDGRPIGEATAEHAKQAIKTIAQNPGALVDGITAPYKEAWAKGEYGEAVGRGTLEAASMLVGTRGVDKLAKGGKATAAAKTAESASAGAKAANLTERLASSLHDDWRAARNYEPRLKEVDGKTYDIANLEYKDLPEKFKVENRASAEVVSELIAGELKKGGKLDDAFVERASVVVHDKWLERNGAWAEPGQKLPFKELTKVEADKDRAMVRKGLELL